MRLTLDTIRHEQAQSVPEMRPVLLLMLSIMLSIPRLLR